MAHKSYCAVSGVFFSLVGIAHLVRVSYDINIVIDDYPVPMFVSWFAILVPTALAIWAFKLAAR